MIGGKRLHGRLKFNETSSSFPDIRWIFYWGDSKSIGSKLKKDWRLNWVFLEFSHERVWIQGICAGWINNTEGNFQAILVCRFIFGGSKVEDKTTVQRNAKKYCEKFKFLHWILKKEKKGSINFFFIKKASNLRRKS